MSSTQTYNGYCELVPPTGGAGRGAVAILRLTRPEILNALCLDAVGAIRAALHDAATMAEARALIVTGAGRFFCAGAELSDSKTMDADGVDDSMRDHWNPMITELKNFPKPTVAVVNGGAVGAGFGVALACDVTIAGHSSYFSLPFTSKLGVSPDLGSTWQLARRLGRGKALPLALLGTKLSAAEAETADLIWEVVDEDELMARGMEHAGLLAALPNKAILLVRTSVDEGTRLQFPESIDLERQHQAMLFKDPESKEFLATRKEHFQKAAARRAKL